MQLQGGKEFEQTLRALPDDVSPLQVKVPIVTAGEQTVGAAQDRTAPTFTPFSN